MILIYFFGRRSAAKLGGPDGLEHLAVLDRQAGPQTRRPGRPPPPSITSSRRARSMAIDTSVFSAGTTADRPPPRTRSTR